MTVATSQPPSSQLFLISFGVHGHGSDQCFLYSSFSWFLTGVAPGEGTGATMSDDDEDQADSENNLFDESMDGGDNMGFGPLVPSETERSLMERVRQELKHELKQVKIGLQTLCFILEPSFEFE